MTVQTTRRYRWNMRGKYRSYADAVRVKPCIRIRNPGFETRENEELEEKSPWQDDYFSSRGSCGAARLLPTQCGNLDDITSIEETSQPHQLYLRPLCGPRRMDAGQSDCLVGAYGTAPMPN